MAVSGKVDQVKLVIRVSDGGKKLKNLMYNRIKAGVDNTALFAAAKAIGSLQPKPMDSVYRHDITALSEEA